MKFNKKRFDTYSTEVEYSLFSTKNSDVAEQMIMIHSLESNPSFEAQLKGVAETFYHISNTLSDSKAVFVRVFLSDTANQTDIVKSNIKTDCPLSIIEQAPLNRKKIALWAYFQSNIEVTALESGLYRVSHNKYNHYWSTAQPAKTQRLSSNMQTQELLLNYTDNQLSKEGCTLFNDTIRTWFFVQNVDVNYAGVVEGRNIVFDQNNLTSETHFISSTGIQGRVDNYNITSMMDAYSVKGLEEGQIQFLYAPTHLNSTYEYGVRFERGTAVHYGDRSHIFISGTASIDNKGNVVHVGDVEKQTYRMLENIETLLKEGGSKFDDVAQMIIYLRDIADYDTVKAIFDSRFSHMPRVIVLAPVCRPTWLIEVECIAIRENDSQEFSNY